MGEGDKPGTFEEQVIPHFGAAYNLARWLTRNDHDAEDVVQEAYLRAFKFFSTFRGGDARAWMLKIVRNTFYSWTLQARPGAAAEPLGDEVDAIESEAPGPEAQLIRNADRQLVRDALEELPLESREVIVLRELEGLSYKEIADVSGIPLGTVMSRLARARKRLEARLSKQIREGVPA